MKLFEHQEFEQAILQAAKHYADQGLRPALIEKDYYVTEALRSLSQKVGDKIIFKGGTSLSKGWNLIQRFSEDLDIFFDPQAFVPDLGKNGINRELKLIRDRVAKHPAFNLLEEESHTIGGFSRSDKFSFKQHFAAPGEVINQVLVESGVASGREPTEIVQITSLLASYLKSSGITLGADDEEGFPMKLLHFRRTFVEKLFAIHSKVELLKRDNKPIGSYARHYYDLYQLSLQKEVIVMLNSSEYSKIKEDYDRVSRAYFPKSYFCPDKMSFANSDAIFPKENFLSKLGTEYESQCKLLCFGIYPSWEVVLKQFNEMKAVL